MKKKATKESKKESGPSDWLHKNKSQSHEVNYERKTKPFQWGNGQANKGV